MAELTGHDEDLEYLRQWFSSDQVKVIQRNERWFLDGEFLQGCETADEVIQKADAKLELMCAAALIESTTEPMNATVVGAAYADKDGTHFHTRPIEMIVRSSLTVRCLCSERPSLPERALISATSDENLKMALILWGDSQRTWPRLYRIAEDVYVAFRRDYSRKCTKCDVLFKAGLIASMEECRSFFYTACEASYSGCDARHALGNNRSAEKRDEMKHPKAVQFVGSLLCKALRRKYELQQESYRSSTSTN